MNEIIQGDEEVMTLAQEVDLEVLDEIDPGFLVSKWYKLDKAYQAAVANLSILLNDLNSLRDTLANTHGIQVAYRQAIQTETLTRDSEVAGEQTPIESAVDWQPPVQGVISQVNTSTSVDQIRKLALEGSAANEQEFSQSIAQAFANIEGLIK